MLKKSKAKIIFVDRKFKITFSNNVTNMLRDYCKETPLYS